MLRQILWKFDGIDERDVANDAPTRIIDDPLRNQRPVDPLRSQRLNQPFKKLGKLILRINFVPLEAKSRSDGRYRRSFKKPNDEMCFESPLRNQKAGRIVQ